MRGLVVRGVVTWMLVAGMAASLPMLLPGDASAQSREFTGKVDRITGKQLFVDNRKGDKLTFEKVDATTVEGEKQSWGDIRKDDWVSVTWQMMDSPRVAYKIVVMPPKDE